MFLASCSISETVDLGSTSQAICNGFETPIEQLADSILDNQENTPEEIILRGTQVIRVYDGVC